MFLSQEHAKLKPLVEMYQHYRELQGDLEVAHEMISSADKELQTEGHKEARSLEKEIEKIRAELIVLLLPQDPNDDKNVLLEIRAGTGGDEAALFAADLARMYQRFAEKKSWIFETMSLTPSHSGGLKEAVYLISGRRVYSSLKHEVGVHRVQRVPATESQGRLHTSACTVAVLVELDDVEIELNPQDFRN